MVALYARVGWVSVPRPWLWPNFSTPALGSCPGWRGGAGRSGEREMGCVAWGETGWSGSFVAEQPTSDWTARQHTFDHLGTAARLSTISSSLPLFLILLEHTIHNRPRFFVFRSLSTPPIRGAHGSRPTEPLTAPANASNSTYNPTPPACPCQGRTRKGTSCQDYSAPP